MLGVPRGLYGTLAVASVDYPASSCLGGFKESSSANHPCQQCRAPYDEAVSEVCAHMQ